MLKDTKSLGNNKAPACESRGFVHKKRGVHFDTPPFLIIMSLFSEYKSGLFQLQMDFYLYNSIKRLSVSH